MRQSSAFSGQDFAAVSRAAARLTPTNTFSVVLVSFPAVIIVPFGAEIFIEELKGIFSLLMGNHLL